jgi:1-aminocyclopropane-1-carboxylate deaminase/D-cysteine desulfhydrase-like pyridoxal-dependent ACC family enzyme
MPVMMPFQAALERLAAVPALDLWAPPSSIHDLSRLRAALGGGPRLMVKRDDAIPFGFGGNKVRKIAIVAAAAIAEGADTLMSVGGVQSNSARVVAAVAARAGLKCVLVLNGARPDHPTANALIDALLGAEVHYVESRADRAPAMARIAEDLRRQGRRPYEIPLGASTPLGALGFARAVGELAQQGAVPDVIVHATSSGGTQAGLVAGCTLHGLPARVLGISADDPAASIRDTVRTIISGMGDLLGTNGAELAAAREIEVDDAHVGEGYGVPSEASREAVDLLARHEAMFVDHTYTAKALAGLIHHVRRGTFADSQAVLFWHTGGQVGLFA